MIKIVVGWLFLFICLNSYAQDDLQVLSARGKDLYWQQSSCWGCHGEKAEGRVGPSLQNGPTPFDIWYQLNNNPQMAPLSNILKPTDDDLLALSVYILELGGHNMQSVKLDELRAGLDARPKQDIYAGFELTERDKLIQKIESFSDLAENWQRKAKRGSIKSEYKVRVAQTFDPGKPKFKPRPGHTYFYENLSNSAIRFRAYNENTAATPQSTQVVVGDAITREVIASYELPIKLSGSVHTTAMSPDGRYVYITGSKPELKTDVQEFSDPMAELRSSQVSVLKVDALTLQPVKQLVVGARLHHGQVFQDKYVLMDSFARDENGLDVFLLDPETDEIVGGVRDEDLGGASYTAFTDGEFIYILMQPAGYGPLSVSGFVGANEFARGSLTVMRPFWIAKIDPKTWEVVREYPYPGYRGDWIAFDAKKEHMYVPAMGTANLSKINMETGEVVWVTPTGTGPYGANLNIDGSEVWVADKGESGTFMGRTVTVISTETGTIQHTLLSAYAVDHVLLAPNGREFWLTSNREGKIVVFDAEKHEMIDEIEMPKHGDPHGLVWVHYDDDGRSKVVRDQGGFHNGIDPRAGNPLDY